MCTTSAAPNYMAGKWRSWDLNLVPSPSAAAVRAVGRSLDLSEARFPHLSQERWAAMEGKGDAGGLVVLRQVARWVTRMVLGMPPALFPPALIGTVLSSRKGWGTRAESKSQHNHYSEKPPPPCLEFPGQHDLWALPVGTGSQQANPCHPVTGRTWHLKKGRWRVTQGWWDQAGSLECPCALLGDWNRLHGLSQYPGKGTASRSALGWAGTPEASGAG